MQKYDGLTNGVCNEMVSIRFDINGHVENSFCNVIFILKYDMILGNPWIKKTVFSIILDLNLNVYGFDFLKSKSKMFLEKKNNETGLHANIIIKVLHAIKKGEEKTEIKNVFNQLGWYK